MSHIIVLYGHRFNYFLPKAQVPQWQLAEKSVSTQTCEEAVSSGMAGSVESESCAPRTPLSDCR